MSHLFGNTSNRTFFRHENITSLKRGGDIIAYKFNYMLSTKPVFAFSLKQDAIFVW